MAQRVKHKLGNRARGRQISSNKAKYERQWLRTDANRFKKRMNHLQRHPNDLQAYKIYG